jgi:hypothetical protein
VAGRLPVFVEEEIGARHRREVSKSILVESSRFTVRMAGPPSGLAVSIPGDAFIPADTSIHTVLVVCQLH